MGAINGILMGVYAVVHLHRLYCNLENSEDPNEMPQNAAFHKSALLANFN